MKTAEFECCNVKQLTDYEDSFEIEFSNEPVMATYCGICDFMVVLGYLSIFEEK